MTEARLRVRKKVYLVPDFVFSAVSPASNGWAISPAPVPDSECSESDNSPNCTALLSIF